MAKRAPITPLRPKADKIIASISYLIQTASDEGLEVTQYDLVKSLFVADRSHLNTYGRPITFDNYAAMKDGPVPSLAYNFLKRDNFSMRKYRVQNLPWKSTPAPHIGEKAEVFTLVEKESSEALSESDKEELKAALAKVKKLGFKQVRKLTHEDPAYLEAWDENSPVRSFSMSLSLFYDKPNEEEAKNLAFFSQHT
jgi:uncharacterized phage-associated protein